MLGRQRSFRGFVVAFFAMLAFTRIAAGLYPVPRHEATIEELKVRVASAETGERPHLCVRIAQMTLSEADKLYAAGEIEKGQAALADVVTYSELARDNAIQSRKYQKESEIAIRAMARKLTGLMHSVAHDDQSALKQTVDRLEKARDDLMNAMFRKGGR